jgi:apolipoprotein N-acyltransferase
MRQNHNEERGTFERHAQSIIAAVILAVVLYSGKTMQEVRDQSAKTAAEVTIFQKAVSERVTALQTDVTNIRQEISRLTEDRYRQGDMTTKMSDLEARLRVVEKDHAKINK